jgi:hypothetical protein
MVTDLPIAALKAGVAKADITPPVGQRMWGFAARVSPATGTLDPLLARVLVLEVGEKRLALVALDLGRPFGPASLARLREDVKKSSGISYVLVVASHTHSGPVIKDEYAPRSTPLWESIAIEKIARAIDAAHERAAEARLGTGYGIAYISHNRRRVNPDGTITWFDRNLTRIPTSPVDPTVSVLRVDTSEGQPLAILVNYACHPVVFGADNLKYSADFPGVMARRVEQAFGGQPVCFFLQGAPADINPYYAVTPLEEDAGRWRDWTGERLGHEAARVAKGVQTESDSEASLDFAEDSITFHLRWEPEKFREALLRFGEVFFEDFAPAIREEWQLPVATVLLNKRIAFMTVPGEAFVEFQINWRERCPVRNAFFLGYANGYCGYFPTIQAASEGGYGGADATAWVEVGAGERMVDHALVRIYQMLGHLTNTPQEAEYE